MRVLLICGLMVSTTYFFAGRYGEHMHHLQLQAEQVRQNVQQSRQQAEL
jgi:hypothetical protein